MPDNILINFTADPSGLQPGIEGLTQLEAKDKELAAQVAKTSQEIAKRDKALTDGAKLSAKSVESLSTAFSNLSKIQVGAAFNKALADIKNNLNLTDKQLTAFYQNVKKGAQERIVDGVSIQELKTLQTIIQGADKALKQLGEGFDDSNTKSKSFRVQLRELRDELQLMEEQGLENTREFEQMQIKAGALADQIGDTGARIKALSSDAFPLDAIVSGVEGISGAFAVAQGAAALFGDENEDLQKAILKVQGAMSLLQGVQAISNVLQKQSAASIAIDILLKRNQSAVTTAQAVAETELAVATEGATVATGAFNAVLAVNPAVLLLSAIAALAAAMYYFSNSEDDARENVIKANEALSDQLDIAKQLRQATADQVNEGKRTLENQIAYARAGKTSIADISKLELEAAHQRAAIAQIDAESHADEIGRIEEYRNTFTQALQDIDKLREQSKATPDAQKEIDDQIKVLQGTVKNFKDKYDAAKEITTEYYDSNRDLQVKQLEFEKFNNAESLKSATAFADARVLMAKVGSSQEFAARRAALTATLNEELDNVNLTEGEKAKLRAKYARDNQDLDREQQIRGLQIAKAGVDAQVLQAKEGSKERFDYEIKSIELQRDIELKAVGLSEKEKARIREAYREEERKKLQAYNLKVAQDAINTRIENTNAALLGLQLAGAQQNNEKVLQLKESLIEEQTRLEVAGVMASEKNEELKAAKIKAIYAKQLADKTELERQKAATENQQEFDFFDTIYQKEVRTNEAILANSNSTVAQRKKAREDLATFQMAVIDNERAKIEEDHRIGILGEIEYYKKLAELEEDYAKLKRLNEEKDKVIDEQIRLNSEAVFMSLFDAYSAITKSHYDEELAQAKNMFDQKLISEREYNAKVGKIKQAQAQQDKVKALFGIAIQTAENIVKAFDNPFLIALAAGLGVTQAAVVLAQPLPKYKKGKVNIDGPGTATSDSILARISKGESVINADMTGKHRVALEAINTNRFEDYLNKFHFPEMPENYHMPPVATLYPGLGMPQIPKGIENRIDQRGSASIADIEKIVERQVNKFRKGIAKDFAQELKQNPHLSINMDEHGFSKALKDGIDTINIKNKKLLD